MFHRHVNGRLCEIVYIYIYKSVRRQSSELVGEWRSEIICDCICE